VTDIRVDKILVGTPTYKVLVGNTTLVDKIVVGTPIRTVTSTLGVEIKNISGIDTTGAKEGSILAYDSVAEEWQVSNSVNNLLTNLDFDGKIYPTDSSRSEILIRRSSTVGSPTPLHLRTGELAYSSLADAGSNLDGIGNGGDRLYIGTGVEVDSHAAEIAIIGGKYFTNLLTHAHGISTASSALILDANKQIDRLSVSDSVTVPNLNVTTGTITNLTSTTLTSETLTGKYLGFDSDLGTKTTDNVTEGTRLYYTQARTDSDVKARLRSVDGTILPDTTLAYDIGSPSFRFRDIYLAGGTLYVGTLVLSDSDGRLAVKDSDGNRVQLEYGPITTDSVSEGTTNLYYTTSRADSDFDVRLATKTTDNLTEGSKLYYTTVRFDSDLATKTTDNITEGTRLYYTTTRFDSDFGTKTTDNLTEGAAQYFTVERALSVVQDRLNVQTTDSVSEGSTNLYYTPTRFDNRLATKTTDDLTEGGRKYYTDARVTAVLQSRLNNQTTDSVSEGGTNLYYTTARADSDTTALVTKIYVDALNVDADTLDGIDIANIARTDIPETFTSDLTIDGDVPSVRNVTMTGYLRGPAEMVIDPSSHGDIGGKVVILGDLQVDGVTTTINSTTVSINDKNIILADSALDALEANGAGITVNGANATITYSNTVDGWVFNKKIDVDGTISGKYVGFDSDFGTKTTSNIPEGSNQYYTTARALSVVQSRLNDQTTDSVDEGSTNLYYTTARANTDFDTRLATKTTDNLTEGPTNRYYTVERALSVVQDRLNDQTTDSVSEGSTNLYFTVERALPVVQDRLNDQTTDSVSEGSTNLYYTTARVNTDFDTRLATKTTDNLTEGVAQYFTVERALSVVQDRLNNQTTDSVSEGSTNLYYTTTRVNSDIDTRVTQSFVEALNVGTQRVLASQSSVSANHYLMFREESTSIYDSVNINTDLKYNPSTKIMTLSNLTTTGDITVTGNLKDGSGRTLQILDSAGAVLWG
jgi:hypothetical protein